jgi:hypothetical protein
MCSLASHWRTRLPDERCNWGIVLLTNIILAIIAHLRGQRVSTMSRLVVLVGWVVAVVIDFAHH